MGMDRGGIIAADANFKVYIQVMAPLVGDIRRTKFAGFLVCE
jgi:hypothetical protein